MVEIGKKGAGEKEKELEEKKQKNPLAAGKSMGNKYRLIMDEMGAGVERYYFWLLDRLPREPPYGFGYEEKDIEKIKDVFTASETSSYWGVVEQRKGLQQEQISKYMASVGKMVKDMFQILRELRITDERLQYYVDSDKGDESAEMALKGIWIDVVEGGAKNPTSVLGMASQVGFVILPDLFFKLFPKTSADVDKEVEKLAVTGINRKVREVLKRKLKQFMLWKEKTRKELDTGKRFKLKYLRQHYSVIKMYMGWLRPYLRNVRRLQMAAAEERPSIVAAFETSEIELELLVKKRTYSVRVTQYGSKTVNLKKYFPCVLIKFKYTAIPQMAYQQEYQRGAIHTGRSEMIFEGYVCTEEEIEEYKRLQEEEDVELLASVNSAMEALGDELVKYLEEAGEVMKKEEEEKPKGFFEKYFKKKEEKKGEGLLEPFSRVIHGFAEMFGAMIKVPSFKRGGWKEANEKEIAMGMVKEMTYMPYYVMKKAYGLMTE